MALLVLILLVCLVITAGVGMLAHRSGRSLAGGPFAWGESAAARFGRLPGAAIAVVAGAVLSFGIMLAVAPLALALQHPIDDHVFNFFQGHVPMPDGTKFGEFNTHMTVLGDRSPTEAILLFSLAFLVFAYGREWWIPVSLLVVMALIQYEGQSRLDAIVNRDAPPVPSSGTFPSGGVSRLITIYGTIAVLVVLLLPPLTRAWQSRIWTIVMFFAVIEAYTRMYLSLHWLTDALAGLLYGGMLMMTAQAAAGALRRPGPDEPRAPDRRTAQRAGSD